MSSISQLQYEQMLERTSRNRNRQAPLSGAEDEQRPPLQSESELQNEIENWLKANERNLRIMWTRNRIDKPSTCEVGRPDFIGSILGKAWAIEIKKAGQKATIQQEGELLRWQLSGAFTGVAHSLSEFQSLLGIALGEP